MIRKLKFCLKTYFMVSLQNTMLNTHSMLKFKIYENEEQMSGHPLAILFFLVQLSAKYTPLVSITGSACVNILVSPVPYNRFLYHISSDLTIWNQLQEIHLGCIYFHKKPGQQCLSQRWISTSNMLLSALLFMFQGDFVAFSSQECVTLCCLYIEDINGRWCHFSF